MRPRCWLPLLLILCSCTMPIQTSTQVRTVQTTDLGVVKNPAMDLLASHASAQNRAVVVDVVRLQACARVFLERKEVTNTFKRKLAPARIAVELAAIGAGGYLFYYGITSKDPSQGVAVPAILHGALGALAGMVVFVIDNGRTFEKKERGNLFVHHAAPSFVCEQKPESDADVLLRFPDGNSLRETTGLDGRAIFPEDRVQPLLQRNQGHFRPWINGQPHPEVTLPPGAFAR